MGGDFIIFQTYGVQYIEFWVIFAIGNSNQVTSFEGSN
jgi:hypothetical protein